MGEGGRAVRMVLCETEEVRRTYTLNSFGQTISSYEELCYIVSGQYLYFLVEGIPKGLRQWIEEELGLTLSEEEETKKQLEQIISYRNYFTEPERRMLVQQMRTAYLYSSVRKHKMLGDLYLKHCKYLSAYHAYQKAVSGLLQLKTREQQEVLYHTGLCLTRMFRFQEAKEFFQKSCRLGENKRCQEAYFIVSYMQGDHQKFLEDGKVLSFTEEQLKEIYENISGMEEKLAKGEETHALKKIDYHRKKPDDLMTRRLTWSMLERWKNEYRREIV